MLYSQTVPLPLPLARPKSSDAGSDDDCDGSDVVEKIFVFENGTKCT